MFINSMWAAFLASMAGHLEDGYPTLGNAMAPCFVALLLSIPLNVVEPNMAASRRS